MSDIAINLLEQVILDYCSKGAQSLWLVDESVTEQSLHMVRPNDNLHVVSNRFDVFTMLQRRGYQSVLSDFDFSQYLPSSLDAIFFRVCKEKAVVHHVINQASIYLKDTGALCLSGYKNEGIKTYVDKAASFLNADIQRKKGGKTSQVAMIRRREGAVNSSDQLPDSNYSMLREVNAEESITFHSKPGVFGWNKIDQGSALMVKVFPEFFANAGNTNHKVIDLGCGYGYLSLMASQYLKAQFIATDNNVAAVNACNENFKHHGLKGRATVDDCATNIKEKAEYVICNPPFHQGFSVESDLTLKFLTAAKKVLRSDGRALFVVNSFIPVERKAETLFSGIRMVENNGQFKVVELW